MQFSNNNKIVRKTNIALSLKKETPHLESVTNSREEKEKEKYNTTPDWTKKSSQKLNKNV